MKTTIRASILALSIAAGLACAAEPAAQAPAAAASAQQFPHVDWSRNANIYEVNIRQYSPEGTFKAFDKDLPRLQKMGVKILWLMPINPIGEKNRKGKLGSYYAVKDYKAVNPEFGTLDDFRDLVKHAHALGMHLIIDWVPNHTAWDNPWVTEHPDWYKKNAKGEIYAVTFGEGAHTEQWTDVVGLDYKQRPLWDGMVDAMQYWIKTADVDGFRCDVASGVPIPFWNYARDQLDKSKHVFMLAEGDNPAMHQHAFDMTYDWALQDVMVKIAKGKADTSALRKYLADEQRRFPADAYRMTFTTNHDKNTWDGSDTELYGKSFKVFAMLTATMPGMPLVYDGEESVLDKRLEFFQKDPINWKNYALQGFYTDLLHMKLDNPALANGQYGGSMEVLPGTTSSVFAFKRTKGSNVVSVVANLSDKPQQTMSADGSKKITLAPWAYQIHTQK